MVAWLFTSTSTKIIRPLCCSVKQSVCLPVGNLSQRTSMKQTPPFSTERPCKLRRLQQPEPPCSYSLGFDEATEGPSSGLQQNTMTGESLKRCKMQQGELESPDLFAVDRQSLRPIMRVRESALNKKSLQPRKVQQLELTRSDLLLIDDRTPQLSSKFEKRSGESEDCVINSGNTLEQPSNMHSDRFLDASPSINPPSVYSNSLSKTETTCLRRTFSSQAKRAAPSKTSQSFLRDTDSENGHNKRPRRNSLAENGTSSSRTVRDCTEYLWPGSTTMQGVEHIIQKIPKSVGARDTWAHACDFLLLADDTEDWFLAFEQEARAALMQLRQFCVDHAEDVRHEVRTRPVIFPFWALKSPIPAPHFTDPLAQEAYTILESSVRGCTSKIQTPFHPEGRMTISGPTAVQLLRFWCRYPVFWMLLNGASEPFLRTFVDKRRLRSQRQRWEEFSPCCGCGGWIRDAETFSSCPVCGVRVQRPHLEDEEPLEEKHERYNFILATIDGSLRRPRVIETPNAFQVPPKSAKPSHLLTIVNSLNVQLELICLLRSLCPGLTFVTSYPVKPCAWCAVYESRSTSPTQKSCHFCAKSTRRSQTPLRGHVEAAIADRIETYLGVTEPDALKDLHQHMSRMRLWDANAKRIRPSERK